MNDPTFKRPSTSDFIELDGPVKVNLLDVLKLPFGRRAAINSMPMRQAWDIPEDVRAWYRAKDHINMPATMEPRPYQIADAVWMYEGKRRLIRHWPGLGKTLIATLAAQHPTLVTCPGYLVEQWADFIKEQYPNQTVANTSPTMYRQQRQSVLNSGADWIVVNHEMFATTKTKQQKQAASAWDGNAPTGLAYDWPGDRRTVIIDESHYFRNKDASRSEGLNKYLNHGPNGPIEFVYELTATPQYKDIGDWYNQLRLLDPKYWSSYYTFLRNYALVTDSGWGLQIQGVRNVAAFTKELQTYVKGRTYEDVGLFLPPLIEKTIRFNLPPQMQKLYNSAKDGYRIEGIPLESAAEVLHTLRTFTGVPEKTDAIRHIIEDTPQDEPVIVFCYYRFTAEELANDLADDPALGGTEYISGDLPPDERVRLARDTKNRIKVATVHSLSEGVDLSASRTVIFAEEDYTPGRMYQALSRVRRHSTTGKTEPVLVYYIHARGTVDENVHKAVVNRQSSVVQIVKEAIK